MKTFADFNLQFEQLSECLTCRDGYCSNTSTYNKTGEEYNVQISTNPDYTDIEISATSNSNTNSSSDIVEYFNSEESAVDFLCKNFNAFRCV
tara:strand:- start:2928 stop:3203 length:276 start_codon:yes stop_codon:yes gene_type:complete